ncbi:hypothetical protein [Stutzerimonas nitrititolerans]|uniref:hypothetical protein n=1 Tax=Stutzerimonas nitrititolerans TaxID=2482751 RepID=UPI0028ACF704|nr:hypothetical protein [Stutzerimonas nitrititolerans]
MNEPDKRADEDCREDEREPEKADIPEHMKPENLEKLRDYGKDGIPPGGGLRLDCGSGRYCFDAAWGRCPSPQPSPQRGEGAELSRGVAGTV